MANYANLEAAIQAAIYNNGQNLITGTVLQSVLLEMVDELGKEGFIYGGVVTPADSPADSDSNLFYLAATQGEYTNFGDVVVSAGELAILTYSGGAWTAQQVFTNSTEEVTEIDLALWRRGVFAYYISLTTNKWTYSNATNTFYVPCLPNTKYRIEAQEGQKGRYAILKSWIRYQDLADTTPAYATGETALHEFKGTVEFTTPADGYFLAINKKLSNTDIEPKLYQFPIPLLSVRKRTETLSYQTYSRLDCRVGTANFGLIVAATNTSWGATQPVWVKGASVVRAYTSQISTSSNYYDWTGSLFYDKNMKPLTEGMVQLKRGTAAYASWLEYQVPKDACYFIITGSPNLPTNELTVYYEAQEETFGISSSAALPYTYFGEKISVSENNYGLYQMANNGQGASTGQSAAVYGKYLFIIHEYLQKVGLFNLENNLMLSTLNTGIAYESFWHCNQACFGGQKYDANDYFPVLYVSHQNDANGRGLVHACRIVPAWTDGEISSFTLTIVQSIHLPVMTDSNCLGNPNWTYDAERNCVWVYSRNNNSNAANYLLAHFTKFAEPALSDGADITLTDADILDDFADVWDIKNTQGGTINNGRLIMAQGYSSVQYIWLRIEDLYTQRKLVTLADLYGDGLADEPEGVFIYKGNICFTTHGNPIYKIIVK